MNVVKRASRGQQSSSGCGHKDVGATGSSIFDQLRIRLQTLFVQMTPLGYEDEGGFHYGTEPCLCEHEVAQSEKRDFVT